MKRLLLLITTCFVFAIASHGAHIKGGFFSYKYLGPGLSDPNNLRYKVTLTVYMSCAATGLQISNPINFSIFNAGNNTFIQDVSVSITADYFLNKSFDDPCITGNQAVCYYRVIVSAIALRRSTT